MCFSDARRSIDVLSPTIASYIETLSGNTGSLGHAAALMQPWTSYGALVSNCSANGDHASSSGNTTTVKLGNIFVGGRTFLTVLSFRNKDYLF